MKKIIMFGIIKIILIFLADVFCTEVTFQMNFPNVLGQDMVLKYWAWIMCTCLCHVLTLCFIEMSLSNFKASELVVVGGVCVCVCVCVCFREQIAGWKVKGQRSRQLVAQHNSR